MAAQPKDDVVYALHDFEAENEDELSFTMGEEIVVLERDDQYGDGWFSGRNAKGETGLFPQSYTSVTPPELEPEPTPTTDRTNGAHTPVASILANSAQVDQTSATLGADTNTDAGSIRSRTSRRGDSDDDLPNANNHRAQLAARAVAEVAAQQKEREDQLAKRRKADEEAYELARQKGLVDGLQLSDESDEDEVADALLPPTAAKAPSVTKAASPKPAEVALPSVSPTLSASGGAPLTKQRSRTDTIASNYAESTYSAPSSPPVPALPASVNSDAIADFQALAAEPAAHYSAFLDSQTEELSPELTKTPSAPTKFEQAQAQPPAEAEAQSTPVQTSSSFKPAEVVEAAIGAGVAGVAAAAAAVVGSTHTVPEEETKPTPVPETVGPTEAQPTTAVHPTESLTALPATTATRAQSGAGTPYTNGYTNNHLSSATLDLPVSSAVSARSLTTPPPLDVRASTLTGSGAAQAVSSPAASVTSSGFRPGSSAGPIDPSLPYDPRTWGVDEVVTWATGRGFDKLTVSKFQEHEISGDVLLELDVALLKEIDLPAFGRRVHIYNAIKELKARVAPPSSHSTRPGSMLSPSTSGYEPDSPATTMSYATPLQGSFVSPVPNYATNYAGYNSQHGGSSVAGSQDGDVQGLGFEDSRPTSAASQAVKPVRSRSALATSGGHTRSSTLQTTSSNGLEPKIAEETEELDSNAAEPTPEARPPRLRKASTRMSIHRSKQSSDERGSGSSSPSSPSVPAAGSKTPKQERNSFFGATIGRSRKPPPKVPSQLSLDTSAAPAAVPRPRTSTQNNASKRTTRLFSSFGSSGDKSPSLGNRRSIMSPSMTHKEREGPSSMSAKAVDEATAEMRPQQQAAVKAGDLMDKLGTPDYSGWMRKKGEKYNGWKQRFLILKGIHLYWLKSESEQRVKGFINLQGYRVISDPDIHPGEFGFKIVHDTDRAHHFSAAEQVTVRNWMKEIMKATIGRDYTAPVVSSCDIDTLPLKIAQTMNPRPRPPSPTERAAIQKERYAGTNPNTLSAKDAQILMEFAPGSPLMTSPPLGGNSPTTGGGSRLSMMNFPKGSTSPVQSSSLVKSLHVDDLAAASGGTTPGDKTPTSPKSAATAAKTVPAPAVAAPVAAAGAPAATKQEHAELLEWVNDHLPLSVPQVADLGPSLRSGKVLTRLLEELSGQQSGISDADFAAYHEPGAGGDFDATYFDCVFNVFDFITPIISTDGIAMDDMLRGNEPLLAMLLERYREKYP